ncbi:MAG: membrane-bound lytic murein transglycosylase MltF [Cellvibrio sp.]
MELQTKRFTSLKSFITSFFVLMALAVGSATLERSVPPTMLETVLKSGELHVLSTNGAVTFYETSDGYSGFEYTLLKGFAKSLGVKLRLDNEPDQNTLLDAVEASRYHLASAELSALEASDRQLRFSSPYLQVSQQLIFNAKLKTPKNLESLAGKEVIISGDDSHSKRTQMLREQFPDIEWRLIVNAQPIDLLELVQSGEAEYAIIDSHAFELNRYSFPRAQLAFAVTAPTDIAWAFPEGTDRSLIDAAERYLASIRQDGTLAQVTKDFFDHYIEEVTTYEAMVFAQRLQKRLPKWQDQMKLAAEQYDLDWRLLAAIGYQESHWLENARSFTGVRGLMMLTQRTAKEMGVTNREDPLQSIMGGAKYFKRMLDRLPERIQGDDRINFALASYNQGPGHLEDARKLTQRMGGNPDKWEDVRKHMPLLAKAQYYKHAKHGYMRGWEPVDYVDNVRNYYKILGWHEKQAELRLASSSNTTISALGPKILDADESATNLL